MQVSEDSLWICQDDEGIAVGPPWPAGRSDEVLEQPLKTLHHHRCQDYREVLSHRGGLRGVCVCVCVSYQVFKHQCEGLLCVDDVMKCDYVGVFQILK